MKRNIAKNTLSFSCAKSMKYIRTPIDIWEKLNNKYHFTLDACASDYNHLLPKYYTKENTCLNKDWTGEIVYCHPMFDIYIPKFVKKCYESKCVSVMLIPASTHTKYFHEYIYNNPNAKVEFLRKPNKGFRFGNEDGTYDNEGIGYIKPLMIVDFNNI